MNRDNYEAAVEGLSKALADQVRENERLRKVLEEIAAVIEDDNQWYFAANFAKIYNLVGRARDEG